MSQVAELPEPDVEETYEPDPAGYHYRPVPVSAVVGCVLGVLSAISYFGITGSVVAVMGILVSGYALIRIMASRGELGGKTSAAVGLGLSLLFGVTGLAYQSYLFKTELPEGYRRISFADDISRKGFVNVNGQAALHPDVEALLGKEIFVKGFMYPPNDPTGLTGFLLVKDSGTCCFGGDPKPFDMIGVQMDEGRTVDFYRGKVSVAGELELNPEYTGQKLDPIYLMRGHLVAKSKTDLE